MGSKQSTNKIKFQDRQRSTNQPNQPNMNMRTGGLTIVRPTGYNQFFQQQEHEQDASRMRNIIENTKFQQQHTLAKRAITEKIRFM